MKIGVKMAKSVFPLLSRQLSVGRVFFGEQTSEGSKGTRS